MTPHNKDANRLLRRHFLALGLASCCGCTSPFMRPLMRGQTPELEVAEEEKGLELIGDFTRPWGLNWVKLEAVGLVTNLDNTGSDPGPSPQRQMLIGEMQSHEVRDADKILASPTTSMVIVRGYLPPGVQKGEAIDVEIRVPGRSETTSLRSGWLMPARLRQMEAMGGSVHLGNVEGLAQGDVLVDAIFASAGDKVLETRGRVLSGATSATSRDLGLAIAKSEASIRVSTQIGKAINLRFFTVEAGVKKGVANPQRDNFLALAVSPRYKHNLARYLRVIRNIPLQESPVERVERMPLLEKKLLEPSAAALAAIQLEAIGNEAIPTLRQGLRSSERDVRFYAAEALAYLDQPEAAAPLAQAAKDEAAFRWHALTALSSLMHVAALDALNELLHVPSAETRYGAFRALRTRNAGDPATKGEILDGKFRYHVIATSGEPLVHIARSRAPELVVFGHQQRLKSPKLLRAGKRILITTLENGELRAGRYDPGQETVYENFSPELDKLVRTIVKLGGGYSEVIECLQEAKKSGYLEGRLAVEAMPRPNRRFYRDDDPLPEAPEQEGTENPKEQIADLGEGQATTPTPGLFQATPPSDQAGESPEYTKSGAASTYIDPDYVPKKQGFLDRMNPLSSK